VKRFQSHQRRPTAFDLGGEMSFRGLGILGLGLMVAGPAHAQTFSNTIFFGDSLTDRHQFHPGGRRRRAISSFRTSVFG